MKKLAISCHLSGTNFDPDLFLSRFSFKKSVNYKNKPTDLKPFGPETERGKVTYGYGALTLLDFNVLGRQAKDEADLLEFINFISNFAVLLEEYDVEDMRLSLSIGYGQQCHFLLNRSLITALANLGQNFLITTYQNSEILDQEKKTMPDIVAIAKELEIDTESYIHLIKPHIINDALYRE